MGKNDWLDNRGLLGGDNRSSSKRPDFKRELTAITTEIDNLADARNSAVSSMAKQIAVYCRQVEQGVIPVSNTSGVRSHLNSLVSRTKLSDADAKDMLISALAMFLMN